jgi:hypothetical protein
MTKEETFDPSESMNIISGMINNAKNKLADDGFQFIFWGWLVAAAAMIHYVTLHLGITWGYLVWPILLPLGGIISAIYGYKEGKKQKVKTYVDVYLGYLWAGVGIAMFVTLVMGNYHGIKATYFFLMIIYGIATFVSGGLLNYKPLIYGSLFSFAIAIASVFMGEVDQFLCISLSLLCSYIIPGHMLRSKFKSQGNV